MAKDVHSTLVEILGEHSELKRDLGEAHLKSMAGEERYLRDIWS